jgi:hypothetical protein
LTAHRGSVLIGVETGEQVHDMVGEFHNGFNPGGFQGGFVESAIRCHNT